MTRPALPSALLIAPDHGLDGVDSEVENVINYLRPNIVQGSDVTVKRVLSAMIDGGFDLLWISSHGNEDGILLSGGEYLDAGILAGMVRSAGFEHIFLNSCVSYKIAREINREATVDIACTIASVLDYHAYVVGSQMARNLSNGLSFAQAFRASEPGGDLEFIYLPNRAPYPHSTEQSVATKMDKDEKLALDELIDEVERLRAIIDGDPRIHHKGVIQILNDIVQRVDTIRNTQYVMLLGIVVLVAVVAAGVIFR